MINFDNISVYTNESVFYNIYAVTKEECSDDVTLNEDNCFADCVTNFDFALGFAAALLSYCFVSDVFITEVHEYHNPWQQEDQDLGSYERIIWQGSVSEGESEDDIHLANSGIIEDTIPN